MLYKSSCCILLYIPLSYVYAYLSPDLETIAFNDLCVVDVSK